jgi:hypothetical protein
MGLVRRASLGIGPFFKILGHRQESGYGRIAPIRDQIGEAPALRRLLAKECR